MVAAANVEQSYLLCILVPRIVVDYGCSQYRCICALVLERSEIGQ